MINISIHIELLFWFPLTHENSLFLLLSVFCLLFGTGKIYQSFLLQNSCLLLLELCLMRANQVSEPSFCLLVILLFPNISVTYKKLLEFFHRKRCQKYTNSIFVQCIVQVLTFVELDVVNNMNVQFWSTCIS